MAFQQKNNAGSLFKNDRRESENHPHMKGKALIGGQWYWVSAWTKEPQGGGDRYQSLSFQEMTPEQAEKAGGNQGQQRQPAPPPRQQAQSSAPRRPGRPQPEPVSAPFGDEQQFQEDDIPF